MNNVMTLTSPLLRHSVGFDRFNDLFESLRETSADVDNYPPYNIEKLGEDNYRIVMAVAGFSMDDLDIVLEDGKLTVSGKTAAIGQDNDDDDEIEILHRGIATRAFERSFRLADYIKVTGAELAEGLLTINLEREIPEEKKPRMIEIQSPKKALTGKKKS